MGFAFDSAALPANLPVAPDYVRARQQFLEAAAACGAPVESHPHPLAGLHVTTCAMRVVSILPSGGPCKHRSHPAFCVQQAKDEYTPQ